MLDNEYKALELIASIKHIHCFSKEDNIADIKLVLDYSEAIKQGIIKKIEDLKNSCTTVHPSSYEEGVLDGYNNVLDSIRDIL